MEGQKQIEQYGFKFYRIWATNWFYSAEKELKKLVSFIQGIDKEERQETADTFEAFYKEEEIIPITLRPETKKKIGFGSMVTIKNPEGEILKTKFSKTQNSNNKPDSSGIISIYEKSSLAIALTGKTEGETCQLGMLEVYYEILKVE